MSSYTNSFFGFNFKYDNKQLQLNEIDPSKLPGGGRPEDMPLLLLNFAHKNSPPQQAFIGGPIQLTITNKPPHIQLESYIHNAISLLCSELGIKDDGISLINRSFGGVAGLGIEYQFIVPHINAVARYRTIVAIRGDHLYTITLSVLQGSDFTLLSDLCDEMINSWNWLKKEVVKLLSVEYATFFSPEYSFVVQYPSSWELRNGSKRKPIPSLGSEPTQSSAIRIVDFEMNESDSHFECMIVAEKVDHAISLKDYVRLAKNELEKGLVYSGRIQEKSQIISDHESIELYLEDIENKNHWSFVKKDDKVFVISINYNLKEVGEDNILKRFRNSFRFVEEEQEGHLSSLRKIFYDYESNFKIEYPSSIQQVPGGDKGGTFLVDTSDESLQSYFYQNKFGVLHVSFSPIDENAIDPSQLEKVFDDAFLQVGENIKNLDSKKVNTHGYEWQEKLQTGIFPTVDGIRMLKGTKETKRLLRLGLIPVRQGKLLFLIGLEAEEDVFEKSLKIYQSVMDSFTVLSLSK